MGARLIDALALSRFIWTARSRQREGSALETSSDRQSAFSAHQRTGSSARTNGVAIPQKIGMGRDNSCRGRQSSRRDRGSVVGANITGGSEGNSNECVVVELDAKTGDGRAGISVNVPAMEGWF